MARPRGIWAPGLKLAAAGGLGFWLANFAISLTPIAAAYRQALGIPYAQMLVEAALGGLIIGLFVGYGLLRFPPWTPTSPIARSLRLSLVALIAVTVLIAAPGTFLRTLSDPWRWFIVGTLFNALRVLALGVVIGVLFEKITPAREGMAQPRPTTSHHR